MALHLSLFKRCLCVLLCYTIFLSTIGIEPIAQAAINYGQIDSRQWSEGNRTIEYQYDDNGSVTRKLTKTTSPEAEIERVVYEYNLQNRLTAVKTSTDGGTNWSSITEYKYNSEGSRVAKIVDGVTTNYLIDSQNHTGYAQVFEETEGSNRTTFTIGDDVLTQSKFNGTTTTTRHLLYDGQGSTRQLINSNSSIADSYSYDSYGVMLGGNPTPATPAMTNLLYTGEQWDNNAQHYYLRARYYNPLNGLFNQTDPYSGNMQDPQSLHKYLYCHNNPINNIDPSGCIGAFGITIAIGAIIATIGAGLLIYGLWKNNERAANWGTALLSLGLGIILAPILFSAGYGGAGAMTIILTLLGFLYFAYYSQPGSEMAEISANRLVLMGQFRYFLSHYAFDGREPPATGIIIFRKGSRGLATENYIPNFRPGHPPEANEGDTIVGYRYLGKNESNNFELTQIEIGSGNESKTLFDGRMFIDLSGAEINERMQFGWTEVE